MARTGRVISVLVAAGIVIAAVILVFQPLVGSVKDDAAKATIVAAILTLLGTVFTSLYSEINSYHQELSAANKAKRDLIFPLVQKHYSPWINAADALSHALHRAAEEPSITEELATTVLFLTGLFYTVRLRFILQSGGLIILSSRKEEVALEEAYHSFEDHFSWAGSETLRRNSLLQDIFYHQDKPQDPFVLDNLRDNINSGQYAKQLTEDLARMKDWLARKTDVGTACEALDLFASSFHTSLAELFTAWW